mmetsp:Transcript_116898/g.261149  ORF Transcript_116898/g.261149 Transcript_116898/m.261149 type:complete len:240 (+) Transcript_116898:67-786(+)
MQLHDGGRLADSVQELAGQGIAIQLLVAGKADRAEHLIQVGLREILLLRCQLQEPLLADLAAVVRKPSQGALKSIDAGVLPAPVLLHDVSQLLQAPLAPLMAPARERDAPSRAGAIEHGVQLLVCQAPTHATEPMPCLGALQHTLPPLIKHLEGDLLVACAGQGHGALHACGRGRALRLVSHLAILLVTRSRLLRVSFGRRRLRSCGCRSPGRRHRCRRRQWGCVRQAEGVRVPEPRLT